MSRNSLIASSLRGIIDPVVDVLSTKFRLCFDFIKLQS